MILTLVAPVERSTCSERYAAFVALALAAEDLIRVSLYL